MSAGTASDARVRALVQAAERAYSAGRREEAARALDEARRDAPDHPLVLNALGVSALNRGDASGARGLLERAAAQAPDTPVLHLNLALACRAVGDADAELAALDRAIGLNPYFFPALLQKASLLEKLGKAKRAANAWHHALACAPPAEQLPAAAQNALVHGREFLRTSREDLERFLSTWIDEARARHPAARNDRFDRCLDVLLGRKRVYVQQPTFMHFPHLPAIQFYDRADFPWLDALEAATADIRQELTRVLAEDTGEFIPYVANPQGTPLLQWKELNHSQRWSAFYLLRDGARVEEHCSRCPKTAEALSQAPLADVPNRAPTAFFSLLKPKTRIPAHTGVTNTRLVGHLPLVVPAGCRFRVGSETREWREGKAWVFDDTIEHEAWNDSDEPRAILIFDLWNPHLTEAERDLVRAVMQGIEAYYEGDSPLAGRL